MKTVKTTAALLESQLTYFKSTDNPKDNIHSKKVRY